MKKEKEISFYAATDIGRKRTNNEDTFVAQNIVSDNIVLAVAIDGMGGEDGGEVAAAIARDEIIQSMTSPNGDLGDLLNEAVTSANNKIFEQRQKQYPKMGCVLSAVIVDAGQKKIFMAHVGDSRVYQYHENRLVKISHDHSPVGYQEDNGRLTEEEAMKNSSRHLIWRFLGDVMHNSEDEDFIESAVFPLMPNTTLLLCSDGLTDLVTSAEISSVLAQKELSLEQKVHTLIDLANEKGGKDNVTVVLVEYNGQDEEEESPKPTEKEESNKAETEPTVVENEKQVNKGDDMPEIDSVGNKDKSPMVFTHILALCLGVLIGYFIWYKPVKETENNKVDYEGFVKNPEIDSIWQFKGKENDTMFSKLAFEWLKQHPDSVLCFFSRFDEGYYYVKTSSESACEIWSAPYAITDSCAHCLQIVKYNNSDGEPIIDTLPGRECFECKKCIFDATNWHTEHEKIEDSTEEEE